MSREKLTADESFPGLKNRIKTIRADLSQDEFGRRIGVTKQAVSKYEKGASVPSKKTLKNIANHGKVTVGWLLQGESAAAAAQEASLPLARPLPGVPGPDSPHLYTPVDTTILTQIIALVEEGLKKQKRQLKPVSKAHLFSLLYDRYQETGQVPDRETIKEFLRLV